MSICVYSEDSALAKGLVTAAKSIEGSEKVFVVANASNEAAYSDCAADMLITVDVPGNLVPESIADTLISQIRDRGASLVLIGATRSGREVAAKVAFAMDTVAMPDVSSFGLGDSGIEAVCMSYGGKLQKKLASKGDCTVALAGFGSADPVSSPVGAIENVPFVEPVRPIELLGWEEKKKSNVDLATSEVVVCVGRGAATEEGLELCRSLAESLDGDLGCTRPVSDGTDPLMPSDLYIGATGVVVAPKLYVAVGVSGQLQHTMGIFGSKVVVAVDKNKDCLMFKQADYCLPGDLNEIVPALSEALA